MAHEDVPNVLFRQEALKKHFGISYNPRGFLQNMSYNCEKSVECRQMSKLYTINNVHYLHITPMVEGKNAVVANYFGIGDADLCRFNCGFETVRNYSYG